MAKTNAPALKPGLHPRNRHQGRYDFPALMKASPALKRFVAPNAYGDLSIDFADPAAVKALNAALLKRSYGIQGWELPAGYLCPPIPGRADYLHHAADLLAAGGAIPKGPQVRVLDIGAGANCIYPLIGAAEYGWSFLGSEIDPEALASARRILDANPGLPIELRLQKDPSRVFEGLLEPEERFDLSLCNPPFHGSLKEAREGTLRKWRQLGKAPASLLNFGGQGAELWCPGGEEGFLRRMIAESARQPGRCRWFTSLVSKSASLPALRAALKQAGAAESRVIPMSQGQKQSRILAWSFQQRAEAR